MAGTRVYSERGHSSPFHFPRVPTVSILSSTLGGAALGLIRLQPPCV